MGDDAALNTDDFREEEQGDLSLSLSLANSQNSSCILMLLSLPRLVPVYAKFFTVIIFK